MVESASITVKTDTTVIDELTTQRDAAYRERAHLVALLAAHYPAELHEDPDDEGWAIIYVKLPTGQASWHLSPQDQDLFPHVRYGGMFEWDEHTTEEKYRRIREHTSVLDAEAQEAQDAQDEEGRATTFEHDPDLGKDLDYDDEWPAQDGSPF